jgi:hypothetical protein
MKVGDYLSRRMYNVPNEIYVITAMESYGGLVLNYKLGRVRLKPKDHSNAIFDTGKTVKPDELRFEYSPINILILDA